jgi:hypothetical protein
VATAEADPQEAPGTEDAPAAAAPVAASAAPRSPAPADATKPAKASKASKASKGSKDSKAKAKGKGRTDTDEVTGDGAPSVAAHPRAARAVERAKGWGALAGFLLGGYLSLPTHTLADAGLRALIAGIVCYVAVWAGALFVWRRLVMLELRARQHALIAADSASIGASASASASAGASPGQPRPSAGGRGQAARPEGP